jgi:hypothetical protein
MLNATRNQLASGLTLFRSHSGLPQPTRFDSDRYRHSNPCLVAVAFSPHFSAASPLLNLRNLDGTQTRTKAVPSKPPGAPVAFTQRFAWTIAASRPAIHGATILLGAVLTFSAWCAVAATDPDSAKGSIMRAT